ncbi:DUF6216 family protein [Pseudomonas nitroreducens]|uniref:DUF6216 family protein n=1 Tax=Pseudomonas nitroreducens TaxID=46680 RepID=UPI00265B3DDE|nr:DUF6216 family protein [Pseudomonas nitroreducens]MCP1651334.1 hypothetical protein [Pseudomonas nitroreducens]MCP1684141.1 hypothetical protein [Pseudomonas nitroreducens]
MQEDKSSISTISLFLDNATGISTTLALALSIACIFYFIYRARSSLFLRDRLWKLIGGKTEFHNESFEMLRKEARDLEHFRMEFRVPADTMNDANEFISWQKRNEIPTGKIALAHSHIDWSEFGNPKIKGNLKSQAILLLLLVAALTMSGIASLAFTLSPYAIVSFPDSPNFYLKKNEFKLGILSNSINQITCKDEDLLKTESELQKFPLEKTKIVCESINNPKDEEKISRLFKEQVSGGLSLLTISIIYMAMCIYTLIKISAAQDIKRKIESIKSTEIDLLL